MRIHEIHKEARNPDALIAVTESATSRFIDPDIRHDMTQRIGAHRRSPAAVALRGMQPC